MMYILKFYLLDSSLFFKHFNEKNIFTKLYFFSLLSEYKITFLIFQKSDIQAVKIQNSFIFKSKPPKTELVASVHHRFSASLCPDFQEI
jgi:hypothetical protein